MSDNLVVRFVQGPGYRRNRSIRRLLHHGAEAVSFLRQATELRPPDLIFCCLPTPHLCRASVTYGRERGVPVVIDVRDLWPDHYLTLLPVRWRRLFKPLLAWDYCTARGCLGRATGISAISRSYLNWAIQLAHRNEGEADGVFPLGYPVAEPTEHQAVMIKSREAQWRERLQIKADELVAVFVGTFVSSFDFDTVMAAARRLGDRQTPIRFLFAGTGEHERHLREQSRDLPNVAFLGWLSDRRDLIAVLRLADVGLSPYRRGCTMSLPNKPFEYMAAGLPQVSSLLGEMAELVEREHIGLNYAANDVADLCGCLRRLAVEVAERRQLGENARKLFLREYSSEVIYPRLLKHLQAIAVRGVRRSL